MKKSFKEVHDNNLSVRIDEIRFNPPHIEEILVEPEECMFCKNLTCICGHIEPYAFVKLGVNGMKTVGDYGLAKRDSFSKWEKEAKDKEYADSSRLGAKKLEMEKRDTSFLGADEKLMTKLGSATGDQLQEYVLRGNTPS